jgi:hypothetical protein
VAKKLSRLERVRAVRDEITRLGDERDKLYAKTIKALGLKDSNLTYEYFFLQPNGGNSDFEEELQ